MNQILAFIAELSDLQFLAFVLSPQYFDSFSRLALQKDRSPNFLLTLTARVEHFTWGRVTLRYVISAYRFRTLQLFRKLISIEALFIQNVWFFILNRDGFRFNIRFFNLIFTLGIDFLDLLSVKFIYLLQFLTPILKNVVLWRFSFIVIVIHIYY